MRRRVLPFVAVAAVAASVLTGCSAASQADNCVPTLSPGALSDSVKVSGDSADTLKVSFSKATEAANPQRSIVQQADSTSAERGTLVEEGMIFKANLAYVDAVTGEVLQVAPTFGTGEGVPYLADPQAGPVFDAVLCAAVGDTAAVVVSEQDSAAMGAEGQLLLLAQRPLLRHPQRPTLSRRFSWRPSSTFTQFLRLLVSSDIKSILVR